MFPVKFVKFLRTPLVAASVNIELNERNLGICHQFTLQPGFTEGHTAKMNVFH